jgi:hypothetical protein
VDQEKQDSPRRLLVYRHAPEGNVALPADAEGRGPLPGDARIALEDNRVVCYHAETSQELGDYTRVCQQLEEEVAAREAAEQRATEAEEQVRQAETARRATEEQLRQDEAGREALEARLHELETLLQQRDKPA